MSGPPRGATQERLQLARRAADLRSQGLTQAKIAADLGISRTYAQQLLVDPDGAKTRARKDSYGLPCPDCGKQMTGSDGLKTAPRRCADCAATHQHDSRYWTPDRILATFQAFHEATGRSPTAADKIAICPSQIEKFSPTRAAEIEEAQALELPHPEIVRREFGTWRDAVAAAGLTPMPTGGAGHRSAALHGAIRQALLDRLAQGPATTADLAEAAVRAGSQARELTKIPCWYLRSSVVSGQVLRARRGLYHLPGQTPPPAPQPQPQPRRRPARMAREFIVLSKNGTGWIEHGTVEALTPELAVEKAAEEAGEYIAIAAANFRVLKVEPVTRLGVVSSGN